MIFEGVKQICTNSCIVGYEKHSSDSLKVICDTDGVSGG